ncbi:HAD superfamily phosphatase (TIGR01668 family) [Pullulanibacillus pueri]|uniref:YqeG family HAD IIIA-type phosphatase n=1 Tax=Pullulanibacillus pueri TaxID=1437324 RepID=A0A8J2ZX81_9BACL|nr:YqeG family HAD IIIA-type phosphatase [Pullulanibacillus pueri]MBM7683080.1 HAD superfamily phosphatase (TIGR01668 family) [Pullulanibacillus pueri]GGH84868.1 hypothetical protein GCM10007096_28930 [Pullulanibacillus pueri]
MLEKFLPSQHAKSIYEITPDELIKHNIKGIVTDLDNTLVAWDKPEATPELIEWFKKMKDSGISITIVSNNHEQRVRSFSEPLGIPFISKARKPMTRAFQRAIREMGLVKDNVVVIGDQLLTDVLGARRLGVHVILVVPVAQSDGLATRFNRRLERIILSKLRRKGLIDWED